MLVSTTGCIIVLSFMRLVPMCQRFLATEHRNTISSAMLRNLSTMIEQRPSARGSTHTATKADPAYAAAGQTCDARLIKCTRATYKSTRCRKTSIETQAMCTWNGKLNTHERTHHEQPTSTCFAHLVLPTRSHDRH